MGAESPVDPAVRIVQYVIVNCVSASISDTQDTKARVSPAEGSLDEIEFVRVDAWR